MRLLVFALIAWSASATIIDRIAITVGQQVITEQQLDEELRVTAFLNREKIGRTVDARRTAADHLVQQLLVKREMELSHYPLPEEAETDKYLANVQATFGSAADFNEALATYDLTEATLREHLALQLTTLRFIEFRFRPEAGISNSEIEAAYTREATAWRATHPGATPPSLGSSRDSIRKSLLEQRTDEALNNWLEEARKQVNIVYLDKTLQ